MKVALFALLVANVVCVLVVGNSLPLLGGYVEQDSSDPKFETLLKSALLSAGGNEGIEVKKVYRVAVQTVAGTNTYMEASICDKDIEGDLTTLVHCRPCTVEINQPLASNDAKLVSKICLPPFPVAGN